MPLFSAKSRTPRPTQPSSLPGSCLMGLPWLSQKICVQVMGAQGTVDAKCVDAAEQHWETLAMQWAATFQAPPR